MAGSTEGDQLGFRVITVTAAKFLVGTGSCGGLKEGAPLKTQDLAMFVPAKGTTIAASSRENSMRADSLVSEHANASDQHAR